MRNTARIMQHLADRHTIWMSVYAVKPKLPENFEQDTWVKLQAAVKAVHSKQPVASSLEELYRVRRLELPHSMLSTCSRHCRGQPWPRQLLTAAKCWTLVMGSRMLADRDAAVR